MLATLQDGPSATAAPPPAAPPGNRKAAAQTVRRLGLRDFRSYRHLRLELEPGPVVLTGSNGAGKTNLLEAVSLLTAGRGLRRARLAELDRRHPGGARGRWAVGATLAGRDGRLEIETGRAPEGERRQVLVEGSPLRSQNGLAELVGVLWLTPAVDRLFHDAPAGRRRFLDRLVLALDPSHATRIGAYERALRERALLLRQARPDTTWIGTLERRMAETGVAIAAARLDLVQGLAVELERGGTTFPRPRLAVVGEIESRLAEDPALETEERLAMQLARMRAQDAQQGGASHGPHRSDLEVVDAETGAAARDCSTGRQKALLLAIVLAEARLRLDRLGELPVVLLDEVVAHLDARRRQALFDALSALGAQAWLTGTDAATFAALRPIAQHFHINDGSLETI